MKLNKTISGLAIAIILCSTVHLTRAEIINVPADFQTIALAVQNATAGDTIILAPGTYNENSMNITIPLTISSQWILEGDESFIDQTIVNASGSILFSVTADDVEISGLKIINGDHTLDIEARVSIKYNHLVNNADGVSMEGGGGGYVGYNTIENNGSGDDNIDLDIGINGSDILIEHNKMYNGNDDGIEIRLFNTPNQNIHYEIRYNTIIGANNAGIQLISYDVFTGKVFDIHHNIIQSCKSGIGCMEGANTSEDMSGASLMDEKVYLYNNTFIENQMGATGGNNMIAINNIVAGNSVGGFKLFGAQSAIFNNLFHNNNNNDLIGISGSAEQGNNLFAEDPLLNETTFLPGTGSPCIDAGLVNFSVDEIKVIEISTEEYAGSVPDVGAVETDGNAATVPPNFAAEDQHIINYPNPFRLFTNIAVNVSETSHVKVDIFDMTGRKIHTLDAGIRNQGVHTLEWSARNEHGNRLPGGIYLARMNTDNRISNTKMLLLR